MRRLTMAGLAGLASLLLLQAALMPAGAQEDERVSIVPYGASISPEAPPMPAPAATIVSGNFAGDARDELLLYTPGGTVDPLVSFANGGTGGSALTWQVYRLSVSGEYQPVVGDFDGDGHDDIIWYGFAGNRDYLWRFTSFTSVTSTPLQINGYYNPVAGDLTGDGADDVLWYGPGTLPDSVWEYDAGGQRHIVQVSVTRYYQPVVGSFADDATDDVLWYGYGSDPDYLWDFAPNPSTPLGYTSSSMPVNGDYLPLALDEWADGAGGDDIIWVRPGYDNVWDFRGGVLRRWLDGYDPDYAAWPTAGDFLGDGHEDIIWTTSGSAILWDHTPDPNAPTTQLARWVYDLPVG